MKRLAWIVLVCGCLAPSGSRADGPSADELFDAYWSAETDWEQERTAQHILELELPHDSLRVRLARGRPYSAEVPRGKRLRVRVDERGDEFGYIVLVPEGYDPARAYPVRVVLHGSIQRAAWTEPGAWWRRTDPFVSDHWFTVFPAAWEDAPWWRHRQVENLNGILRELRREYHLDEDRVHLMGLSDGGTGTFFHALQNTTPWASFCPFIGHPNVLNHEASRADGQFYAGNLRNKPLLVANGLEDPLYPAEEVSLYLDLFRRAGAPLIYRPQEGGHTVRWWPELAGDIRSFQDQNPRMALPDTLVWASSDPERYGRAHWLVIEELGSPTSKGELGASASEGDVVDDNVLELPVGFSPRRVRAFPRDLPSGYVELIREGNTIRARTRGVRRFRLLLSAGQFDLSRPVTLMVNDRPPDGRRLVRDPEVLFRWHRRDEDRRMLFDAEWQVVLE